jgi:hypothetical protein
MSLYDKSSQTLDKTLKSLQAIQDAGFNAAAAVAEKTPGLPGRVASTATRSTNTWVKSYFTIAQRVLSTERHTAEQLMALNKAFLSPRVRVDKDAPLQAV